MLPASPPTTIISFLISPFETVGVGDDLTSTWLASHLSLEGWVGKRAAASRDGGVAVTLANPFRGLPQNLHNFSFILKPPPPSNQWWTNLKGTVYWDDVQSGEELSSTLLTKPEEWCLWCTFWCLSYILFSLCISIKGIYIVMQEGPSPTNQNNTAKTASIRCLKRFTPKFKLLVCLLL